MKRTLIYYALLPVLLLSGCDKFLDREPLSEITPDKYFKSEAELAAYTINYYPTFFTNYIRNINSAGVINEDRDTDNLIYAPGASATQQWFAEGNTYWQVGAGQALSSYFYKIRYCNYFLEAVLPKYEAGALTGAGVEHYIGEMYVMRALGYFDALTKYGDFPIIETVLPDEREPLVEASRRAPRNEVARFILSDLDKAAELLGKSTAYDANRNRISKNVALLLKSRVALFEATFEKYHSGTPRVPGEQGWPGAAMSYNQGKTFDIPGEIEFFLAEAMVAAKAVADACALTTNNHVTEPSAAGAISMGNPYFDMFAMTNPSTLPEVLMWRAYDPDLNISTGTSAAIVSGANNGATRTCIDGFLMANGLPIYATASGYKGDTSLDLQFDGRDERLKIFVFSNSSVKYTTPSVVKFTKPQFWGGANGNDKTGFRIRKWMTYDEAQNRQTSGASYGKTGMVLYRSAEAYLNYIEACYELNGSLDADADKYWKAIRTRAGVSTDYAATIAATDLAQEPDWARYSGPTLVDATLFNIRRERRNEFIGEGFRKNDLLRWRAYDHLMVEKYIPEGVNLWDDLYKLYEGDANFTEPSENTSGTVSAQSDSKYYRPYRTWIANNDLYDGWTWHKAHYLYPLGERDITIVSSDGTVANSVTYQNPYWPTTAAQGALE
ncbi:MAG: RagB/SusD family nutrient uptake outer membrane protein [Bacteroidales bacterium]|nr:RagB/SusD family nutrient uptake outer membrane protein [Bacteroidales bacterium]